MNKPITASDWQPNASMDKLRQRAAMMNSIRRFFEARGVWEVETPVLSQASITDLQLSFMETMTHGAAGERRLFLQTSPEFAMKRLLCAGSGSIFQLAKVFRDDECGRFHNPEFTMLEWYRTGFDHWQLMDELDELLHVLMRCEPALRMSYGEAFARWTGLDCYGSNEIELNQACRNLAQYHGDDLPRDSALQLLFAVLVEPHLGVAESGKDRPCFIYDYPASQAALAQIRDTEPPVASRFEVYVRGMELANGFHELADAAEQLRRFELDNHERAKQGKPAAVIDHHLIEALVHGLPACAGVAVGVDRLMMLALDARHIDEVVAFTLDRA